MSERVDFPYKLPEDYMPVQSPPQGVVGARVILIVKDKIYTEFQNFTSIQTTCSVNGAVQGTVTFTNVGDRMFRFTAPSYEARTWKETGEQEWLSKVLDLQEIRETWQAMKQHSWGMTYDQYQQYVLQKGFEVHPFPLMAEIIIDYIDRQGNWWAGARGIITSVKETVAKRKGSPNIIVTFKDVLTAYLSRIYIIYASHHQIIPAGDAITLANAKALQELGLPCQIDEDSNTTIMALSGMSNFFQGKSIRTVLNEIVDGLVNKMVTGTEDKYWFRHKLWQTTKEGEWPSEHRRQYDTSNSLVGRSQIYNYCIGNPPGLYISNTFDTKQAAFKSMITNKFSLFCRGDKTANALLKDAIQVTYGQMWVDPFGHLLVDHPRYNTLPSLGDGTKEIDADGRLGHGREYILGDSTVTGFNITEDESPLLTYTTGIYGANYIAPNQTLANYRTVRSVSDVYTQFRYGQRRLETQALFGGSQDPLTNIVVENYTQAMRMRSLANMVSATISLNHRPDLAPGRTVVLLERGMIFYVQGVTQNLSINTNAASLSTSLTCGWGRRLGEEKIAEPWNLIPPSDIPEDVEIYGLIGETLSGGGGQ